MTTREKLQALAEVLKRSPHLLLGAIAGRCPFSRRSLVALMRHQSNREWVEQQTGIAPRYHAARYRTTYAGKPVQASRAFVSFTKSA